MSSSKLPSQSDFMEHGLVPCGNNHTELVDMNCSICATNLVPRLVGEECTTSEAEKEEVVELKACHHFFHKNCILPWFHSVEKNRGTCPNCRLELFEPNALTAAQIASLDPWRADMTVDELLYAESVLEGDLLQFAADLIEYSEAEHRHRLHNGHFPIIRRLRDRCMSNLERMLTVSLVTDFRALAHMSHVQGLLSHVLISYGVILANTAVRYKDRCLYELEKKLRQIKQDLRRFRGSERHAMGQGIGRLNPVWLAKNNAQRIEACADGQLRMRLYGKVEEGIHGLEMEMNLFGQPPAQHVLQSIIDLANKVDEVSHAHHNLKQIWSQPAATVMMELLE